MPETAENVAEQFGISRADQDAFALRSQHKAAAAQASGAWPRNRAGRDPPAQRPGQSGRARRAPARRHHPGATGRLGTPFREGGSVTAGNASGVNDGACALLLASPEAAPARPAARGRVVAWPPGSSRIMGIGPVPATRKVLELTGLSLADMDVIELNEAFAAQAWPCCANWAWPTTTRGSTPTAAPSPWATRWA
jgi:acetyl-CoA acetyltransferase